MPGALDIVKELTDIVVEKAYKEHPDTVNHETPNQTRARQELSALACPGQSPLR
jgi:hypothetical protein